jgi:hypothetical protein
MSVTVLAIRIPARTIRSLSVPAYVLALLLTLAACQNCSNPSDKSASGRARRPGSSLATAATHPEGPFSVMIYIKTVAETRYGLLAHIVGKRDITLRHTEFDPDLDWWDNPLIAYADPPFDHPDVIAQADSDAITGEGASANVDVQLTLVPHAVVAVQSRPRCDAIKGTITVTISTIASFYDNDWTEILRIKDRRLTFSFDTRDPNGDFEQIMHQTSAAPPFSLERYTRDQEKWEPMTLWPDNFKSGDARTIIYGKDAIIDVTGYRSVERPMPEATQPTTIPQ